MDLVLKAAEKDIQYFVLAYSNTFIKDFNFFRIYGEKRIVGGIIVENNSLCLKLFR